MNILLTFLIAIIFTLLPLKNIIRSIRNKTFTFKKHKYDIIFSVLVFIGSFIRLILIDIYPRGIHQDESSLGYEIYSLLNFGYDRNGFPWPVHFMSWGSGQNALYGYMVLPFLALLGNSSVLALRLPMALIGCLTLVVAYKLFKDLLGNKKGAIALFLLVICPWHIMKSRFGLECNVFPDLVFYAITLIYYGIKREKKLYLYLSSIILGISTYSYGTSYLFIPVLLLITYGYLWKKKLVSIKDVIIQIAIAGLVALPMIAFVIINYFGLDSIYIKDTISIPRLWHSRFSDVTSLNAYFLPNSLTNLKQAMVLFITQYDTLPLNQIPGFGVIYPFSIIFVIIGIYYAFKKRNNIFLGILNCLFITSLILCIFMSPNINHINVVWVSIIAYMIYGVLKIISLRKEIFKIVLLTYLVYFITFVFVYFGPYQQNLKDWNSYDIAGASKFAEKLDYKKLYVHNIYTNYVFSVSYPTDKFRKERVIPDKTAIFQQVPQIGNIYFSLPNKLQEGNVYIITDSYLNGYKTKGYTKKKFGKYVVLYKNVDFKSK